MTLPRFSIRAMIFAVLVVAMDLAWFLNFRGPESAFSVSWIGFELPFVAMANVLAVSGYPLLLRREGQPFRSGFVVGGLLGSVVCYAGLQTYPILGWHVSMSTSSLQEWVQHANFPPRWLAFAIRNYTSAVAVCLAGTSSLVALAALFGRLSSLVAEGKVPKGVAVAIVVFMAVSAPLTARWMQYRVYAERFEEICVTLGSEADAISNEMARAKASGPPPAGPSAAEIRVMERELASRKAALAGSRRKLEIYRRVERYPWLPAEDR